MTAAYRDPTATSALAAAALERLFAALAKGNPNFVRMLMLRYGLHDGVPRTAMEVGRLMGYSKYEIQDLEKYFRRSPDLVRLLDGYLDQDWRNLPLDVRARIVGSPRATRVECARHGTPSIPAGHDTFCATCPCPIYRMGERGRPRRFCSNACRQAGFRQRASAQAP